MLETIREYGAERLAESAERDLVRQRHRDWCADLARAFADSWLGPWSQRLSQLMELLALLRPFAASSSLTPWALLLHPTLEFPRRART